MISTFGWRRLSFVALTCAMTCGLGAVRGDSSFITSIEGHYVAPARNCTQPEGDEQVPCDPPMEDCMMIKRVDDSHAKLYVYSPQWNGSECGIDGVAELHGKVLRYTELGFDTSRGKKVDVKFEHGKITFEYVDPPDLAGAPFCGEHAQLNWVEFDLKKKQPLNHATCPDADNF